MAEQVVTSQHSSPQYGACLLIVKRARPDQGVVIPSFPICGQAGFLTLAVTSLEARIPEHPQLPEGSAICIISLISRSMSFNQWRSQYFAPGGGDLLEIGPQKHPRGPPRRVRGPCGRPGVPCRPEALQHPPRQPPGAPAARWGAHAAPGGHLRRVGAPTTVRGPATGPGPPAAANRPLKRPRLPRAEGHGPLWQTGGPLRPAWGVRGRRGGGRDGPGMRGPRGPSAGACGAAAELRAPAQCPEPRNKPSNPHRLGSRGPLNRRGAPGTLTALSWLRLFLTLR